MRESPKHDRMKDRLAELMRDGCWHSSIDLIQVGGLRATARAWELRKEGMNIEKRKMPNSTMYEYRLVQEALAV